MAKIIYKGVIDPCDIQVLGVKFRKWHKNEVRDIEEKYAEKLVHVDGFSRVDNENIEKKSHKKELEATAEEIVSDINIDKSNVIDLDTATKAEMIDFCKRFGIEVYSEMKKDDIKKLIEDLINQKR